MTVSAEFSRYVVVGGLCWAIDTALYWVTLQSGGHYLLAALVGFVVGVCLSHALSVRWVFVGQHRLLQAEGFLVFLLTGAVGLGLTAGLLWVLIDGLHTAPLVAKVLAAALVLGCNYIVRKKVLFSADVRRPAMSMGKS